MCQNRRLSVREHGVKRGLVRDGEGEGGVLRTTAAWTRRVHRSLQEMNKFKETHSIQSVQFFKISADLCRDSSRDVVTKHVQPKPSSIHVRRTRVQLTSLWTSVRNYFTWQPFHPFEEFSTKTSSVNSVQTEHCVFWVSQKTQRPEQMISDLTKNRNSTRCRLCPLWSAVVRHHARGFPSDSVSLLNNPFV